MNSNLSKYKIPFLILFVFIVGWCGSYFFHTKEIKIEDRRIVQELITPPGEIKEEEEKYESTNFAKKSDQEYSNSNRGAFSESHIQNKSRISTFAEQNQEFNSKGNSNSKIPSYVLNTLKYIRENQRAPKGYVGGRQFFNREGLLPKMGKNNQKLQYQEWDVHPKVPGKNRGAERLVTSSEGDAYFTKDHYKSFEKVD